MGKMSGIFALQVVPIWMDAVGVLGDQGAGIPLNGLGLESPATI